MMSRKPSTTKTAEELIASSCSSLVAHRIERGLLDVAVALAEARAAGMEPAGARWVQRARHVALEHDGLPLPALDGVRDRHRRQERARVRVLRLAVERDAVSELGHLAEVHDHDAVRDVAHDVEVVRDEDVRESEVALQVLQQVEYLRLNRDVQRGDRLVADNQLRVDGERARHADSLALAA